MAGGTFDKTVGKVRPGTYVNFIDTSTSAISGGTSGICLIPLANTDYGAVGAYTLTKDSPDAYEYILGHSIYDDDDAANMLLIREAFKNVETVIAYILTAGTGTATGTGGGLTATAKYAGSRGNSLTYSVSANPTSGYDIDIYLDSTKVESYEAVTDDDVADTLAGSYYLTFEITDSLSEIAAVALTGGTDGETSNSDVTDFLDAADAITFNTMAFPFTDEDLLTAVATKIEYMRESEGKKRQVVVADMDDANYEGIINVTNSYALSDVELTHAQATAFVAGATAGATYVESNTYLEVEDAVSVVDPKTHEEAVAAINAGELFFSVSEQGAVIIEYDINSLVTFTDTKGETYRKNRVIRVLDSFHDSLVAEFPPNKFNNSSTGWDIMEGVGKSVLKIYDEAGAIEDVDYDSDFLVDRENSSGDQTYFNVAIKPVDSAEKLYFTVSTR